jgi:CRP/FNR family transcriptional regulator, anaerobic regulatory protein
MDWKKIFPQFEPGLIELLEKNAIQKSFHSGELLMRTGQYIKSTVLVLTGRIKIYRQSDEGSEFLIYYLGPGEACAVSLICALQSQTSEITAKAVEDTEVLLLPVQLMDEMMSKFKSWSHFVIQSYRNRFDEMLTVIDNIAFRNMDERLEFYLKRCKTDTGKVILNLTHQEIADDLNSSREVISRLLKKMEQLGKIKLNRNSIELIDL